MNKMLEEVKFSLLLEHSVEFVVESYEEVSLCEGEGGDNEDQTFLKLTGTFQKGNTPNGNKRIYKTELLARETNRFQTKISSGLALGKIYHPGYFDHGGPSGVTDVSHRITKLWMDGDIAKGELLVFKTASGKDVEAIIEGGGKIGISSRGFGSMKRFDSVTVDGKTFKDVWVVDENYRLETFDLVLTPSVKSAIMTPVKENINSLNKPNEAKKNTDTCNENLEEKDKGGIKSMTLEELKTKYPAIYNEAYEAGVTDGRRLGVTEAKTELNTEHDKAVDVKNEEIATLKVSETALTKKNVELMAENKELTDTNKTLEAAKTENEVKTAVIEAVSASEFKENFGESEIADVCRVVSTVEEAKKEVESRIKFIESVIEKHAGAKKTDSGSKKTDTSEAGSTNEGDEEANEAAYKKQQREAAGL